MTREPAARPGMFGFSQRGTIVLAVVAAIIVAALGFTVGLVVGRPHWPGEGSAEVGFARDMSTHHAQAVEMGMIAYQKATLPEVRTLGGDIALTQKGQIGIMQGWLRTWGVPVNGTEAPMSWMPGGAEQLNGYLMPGMATQDEMDKLNAATGKDVDILFLQYMIRHHLGGAHMIDGVLAKNPRPEVRDLAQTMKNNQQAEVTTMTNLLKQLGAAPLN
jgi:uncharacterized protein (DUF305 family)